MRKERELESGVLCVFDLEGEGYWPNNSVSRRVETHTHTPHSPFLQSEIEREREVHTTQLLSCAHNNNKKAKEKESIINNNNNHCKIISENLLQDTINNTLSSLSFSPASLLLSSICVN